MRTAHGFSLIEMAFVLVIITLLLGGLLVPFATQVEQRRIAETNKAMEEIKEALIGYALSHPSPTNPPQPYLPCPDAISGTSGINVPNDGLEDRNAGGTCDQTEGNLPWATLGLGNQDAWGHRFHYRVSSTFSNQSTGFALTPPGGDIRICAKSTAGGNPCQTVANGVPAVVISFGKNGYGGLSVDGIRSLPAVASDDEKENFGNILIPTFGISTDFVSRVQTSAGTPATEFDDLVIWLSPNVLYNRMVAAGKLP